MKLKPGEKRLEYISGSDKGYIYVIRPRNFEAATSCAVMSQVGALVRGEGRTEDAAMYQAIVKAEKLISQLTEAVEILKAWREE